MEWALSSNSNQILRFCDTVQVGDRVQLEAELLLQRSVPFWASHCGTDPSPLSARHGLAQLGLHPGTHSKSCWGHPEWQPFPSLIPESPCRCPAPACGDRGTEHGGSGWTGARRAAMEGGDGTGTVLLHTETGKDGGRCPTAALR